MTQTFFSIITAIIMLFAPIFGCGQDTSLPVGLAEEKEPTLDEYTDADRIDGVGGSIFYVKRPNKRKYNAVYASAFGVNGNAYDNYDALCKAIEYCAENEYTRLVFEPGNYYFRTETPVLVSGLRNTVIDGNGAVFVFSHADYFNIDNCECIEFANISVKWNDENGRLSSIVKISDADEKNHSFNLIFTELKEVSEDIQFGAFTQYDARTLTPGTRGGVKENYIYSNPEIIKSVEKVGSNILKITHNGALDDYDNGDVFLLRHHVYGGNVFNVTASSNVTFDGINILSAAGMGWLITDRCERFQLLNCSVDIDGSAVSERISSTADAVHIANTNGHFRIDGCSFGFMGDDAVNVHDNLSVINEITGSASAMLSTNAPNINPGDDVEFFGDRFEKLGFTAVVVSFDGKTAVFDRNLPSYIKSDCIVVNRSIDSGNYVITDNRIHENRARGFLLQSSNGLCANNSFYKTMGNAIKVVTDISSGLWLEGTGVNLLEIKDNSFTDCNISDWGAQIVISSNIDGHTAARAIFSNVTVSGNTFTDGMGEMLNASNVNGLTFTENTATGTKAQIILGKHCSRVTVKDNTAPLSPLGCTVHFRFK